MDGLANLYAAVLTAIAGESRDRGVLVVLNDEVFAASAVAKTRSFGVDAFTSPPGSSDGSASSRWSTRSLANPRPEPLPVPGPGRLRC